MTRADDTGHILHSCTIGLLIIFRVKMQYRVALTNVNLNCKRHTRARLKLSLQLNTICTQCRAQFAQFKCLNKLFLNKPPYPVSSTQMYVTAATFYPI